MAIRSITIAVILLSSGIAAASAANVSVPAPEHLGTIYRNPQRTASYEFTGLGANFTQISPKRPAQGPSSPSEEFEIGGGAITHDCSDSEFRCITFGSEAMAVPRTGLVPNSAYIAAGSSLNVVDCYRGSERDCQVALIKVDCLYDGRLDKCTSASARNLAGLIRLELCFTYNRDYGVTSFGFTKFGEAKPETEHELFALAAEYILVGDNGLLNR